MDVMRAHQENVKKNLRGLYLLIMALLSQIKRLISLETLLSQLSRAKFNNFFFLHFPEHRSSLAVWNTFAFFFARIDHLLPNFSGMEEIDNTIRRKKRKRVALA